MLYLATQFAWFLLAAFAMGALMGWISGAGRLPLSGGPLPYAIAGWLLVAALTWLQSVNGAVALWTETALLYVAAYLAGCYLACLIRGALPAAMPEPAVAGAGPMVKPDNPPAVAPVVAAAATSMAAQAPAETDPVAVGARPADEASPEATKQARKKRTKPGKA
ncbi:hypothetical protein [Bosea sp. BK604]|uniref:hypothetical protein n=1 Tax=Bosea sp. BK604 TaxID=2512180 RepID=UPI001043439E|nr:hypothetical protein [Bosea sp. BK604]TCR60516.1 hypothetical protein EV560_1163 [Bosea sp. BK604]